MTLSEIIESAKEDLQNEFKTSEYPEDLVAEIADGAVPLMHYRIAELASKDISLIMDSPELGPCTGDNFIGMEDTPIAYIAANIYERISDALSEELYKLQEESELAEAA